MSLVAEIKTNFDTGIIGSCRLIASTDNLSAWTYTESTGISVLIPNEYFASVNEKFAGVQLISSVVSMGAEPINVLKLYTEKCNNILPFCVLCADFADPNRRDFILSDPLAWFEEWKILLGNKNVDERVYDTLGELISMKLLAEKGISVVWNGPKASSWDLESDNYFYEVKSTINRSKLEVTISSESQLNPATKNLKLIFCVFERTCMNGVSIESTVSDLVSLGFDEYDLREKLKIKGLEIGMSALKQPFQLLKAWIFTVDDDFPAIKPSSFVGGEKPLGVMNYSYTVSLSNLEHDVLFES